MFSLLVLACIVLVSQETLKLCAVVVNRIVCYTNGSIPFAEVFLVVVVVVLEIIERKLVNHSI